VSQSSAVRPSHLVAWLGLDQRGRERERGGREKEGARLDQGLTEFVFIFYCIIICPLKSYKHICLEDFNQLERDRKYS
jgi:hypothetical protein